MVPQIPQAGTEFNHSHRYAWGEGDLPFCFVHYFFIQISFKSCLEKNQRAAVKGVLPLFLCSLSWKDGLSEHVIFQFKVEGFFFPFGSNLTAFRTLLKLLQNRRMTCMLENAKGGSPRLVILRGVTFEKSELLIDLLDVRTPVSPPPAGSSSSFF